MHILEKYWLLSGMSVPNAKTIPKWEIGLHRVGLYFEGIVEIAPVVLEDYYKGTITSFGVRDSSRKSYPNLQHKENGNINEAKLQEGKKVKTVLIVYTMLHVYECRYRQLVLR